MSALNGPLINLSTYKCSWCGGKGYNACRTYVGGDLVCGECFHMEAEKRERKAQRRRLLRTMLLGTVGPDEVWGVTA